MSSPLPSFDELEASVSGLLADAFSRRDETGEAAKLTIRIDGLKPVECGFLEKEGLSTQRVDGGGLDLERSEWAWVDVQRSHLGSLPVPLPESASVTLPGDSTPWVVDDDRGPKYGTTWVSLPLKRKPLVQQTNRRRTDF